MDSEQPNKKILIERALNEVLLPLPTEKEYIKITDVRQQLDDFNTNNGSRVTIWDIFQSTFKINGDLIVPTKPLDVVIKVAKLAGSDREMSLLFDELSDDEKAVEWTKVRITEKVIDTCKELKKKLN